MFPNYILEVDNLEITDKRARTGILIQRDLQYRRRRDLETQGTSTVWIQLNQPGRKALLIQALYRQFRRLGKDNTDTFPAQTVRWNKILDKWELAEKEDKEIISLGDFNLNTLRWDVPNSEKSSYEKQQEPLIEMFKERILRKGFKILNTDPTRVKDTPESKPSCLDLMLTNRLEKIISFQSGSSTFSDHTLQILQRSSKGIIKNQKYIRIRSFTDFKISKFKEDILNHHLYIETAYEQDPNTICTNLQKIIQDSLEPQAPIKILQIKPQTNKVLSSEAKQALLERDIAHMEFKKTNTMEDLRYFPKSQE